MEETPQRKAQRNGTTYTMQTANIGKRPQSSVTPPEEPSRPLSLQPEPKPEPKPESTGGLIFRDGKDVEVSTDAEVEQYQDQLFRVIDSIEALASRPHVR